MNAAHESFSDHSETSTYDIAFLTVSDISNQIGISKSKLYKDIREGKLLAEKSLDETLVVSPRALQQAYQQIDLSQLMDFDFPVLDFLDDADNTVNVTAKEIFSTTERTDTALSQLWGSQPPILDDMTESTSAPMVKNTVDMRIKTGESNSKTQYGSQKARILGFTSVVAICSAILLIALANI